MNTAVFPKPLSSKIWNNVTAREWKVLIVTDRVENRRALLRAFEGLPITAFTAATAEQAREVLALHSVAVIFCEESLAGGATYREVLEAGAPDDDDTLARFAVILAPSESENVHHALRIGATDVLRSPLQAIEVELVLIRAGRERARQGFDVMA